MSLHKRFLALVGVFDSHLSVADWIWRLFTILLVAGGGTIAGLEAKASTLFGSAGVVAWIGVGLTASLLISICFALIRYSGVKGAEKQYIQAMALRGGGINPLEDTFSDAVIHIHDLFLPGKQLHSGKHFKRCIFVGPGSIAIAGGSYTNTEFVDTGDMIPIPLKTILHGVVVLERCTVDQCKFIGVMMLAPQEIIDKFHAQVPQR